MEAVAVYLSMAQAALGPGGDGGGLARLAGFRRDVYGCLTRRGDALFSLADAVLCAPGRVSDLARLSLVPESGRGHGALYDGLNAGRAEVGRLRRAVAGLPLPRWENGQIRLGIDVCNWLRPDAETSGERLFCPVHGRGENSKQMIPGWPYSFVAALGPGRSSWTLPLDAVRLRPHQDETEVAAEQLREVVQRLIAAGHWQQGDPPVLIAMDPGCSGTRLAWLLADLPVTVVARVRSDRVFYRPAPDRAPGVRGRNGRHGDPVRCADPATWGSPDLETDAESARHGPLAVMAWSRVHQMIHRGCGGWDHWPPHREYPLIEGTLIRLAVTAPGRAGLEPMWLWASDPGAGADAEAAAGRWTWLIIACYAQLWLARDLAADIRLPWQRPQPGTAGSQVMTPGRVRAGFRVVRQAAGTPASAGKYARPGPGRPAGSRNKRKAPRRHVGKTILRQHTIDDKNRKKAKPARRTNEQAG